MVGKPEEQGNFAERIIAWQKKYGRRNLPWQSKSAYHVWLSEIMLQQTQVATVIPYFQRFILSFPSLGVLAAATEEQVLEHWSGLGYYSRGRNLHRAAKIIQEKFGGVFPHEHEQLVELPGIGRSTASAICALAFHQRRAILDGNVKRLLSRYCGISGPAGKSSVNALLWQQAESLLPGNDIAVYIQAQMDLGATICMRSKPKCNNCPVQAECVAYQSGRVNELPSPRIRKTVPVKQVAFLMLMHGNDILLEKQPSTGIWGGLWCMPKFESRSAMSDWCELHGIESRSVIGHAVREEGSNGLGEHFISLPSFTHAFTHFKLRISPEMLHIGKKPLCIEQEGKIWIDTEEALQAAIPAPVRKLLSAISSQ